MADGASADTCTTCNKRIKPNPLNLALQSIQRCSTCNRAQPPDTYNYCVMCPNTICDKCISLRFRRCCQDETDYICKDCYSAYFDGDIYTGRLVACQNCDTEVLRDTVETLSDNAEHKGCYACDFTLAALDEYTFYCHECAADVPAGYKSKKNELRQQGEAPKSPAAQETDSEGATVLEIIP